MYKNICDLYMRRMLWICMLLCQIDVLINGSILHNNTDSVHKKTAEATEADSAWMWSKYVQRSRFNSFQSVC